VILSMFCFENFIDFYPVSPARATKRASRKKTSNKSLGVARDAEPVEASQITNNI